jgi:hypothetical protein
LSPMRRPRRSLGAWCLRQRARLVSESMALSLTVRPSCLGEPVRPTRRPVRALRRLSRAQPRESAPLAAICTRRCPGPRLQLAGIGQWRDRDVWRFSPVGIPATSRCCRTSFSQSTRDPGAGLQWPPPAGSTFCALTERPPVAGSGRCREFCGPPGCRPLAVSTRDSKCSGTSVQTRDLDQKMRGTVSGTGELGFACRTTVFITPMVGA